MPLTRIRQTAIGNDSITSPKLAHDLDLDGDFVRVPHGTTAQRPSNPAGGQMRFNTDLGTLEQYNTNTNAWAAIDSPPIISSLAYSGSNNATDPAGGETITLTGSNFKTGFTITIGGTSAASTTFVDSTTVRFTTPAKTAGDYDVVFTNANGLAATLTAGISVNGTPAFTTAAGNVGSVMEDEAMATITIVAAEPDGGTLAFSITSGALPTGVSLGSANGQLTGTPNVNQTANTTYNFTVTATDDENQTNSRAFNLIVLRPIYAQSLAHSLRLDGTSSYIHRTFGSPTDLGLWTMSCWIKRANHDGTTDSDCIIGSSDSAGGTSYGDMIRLREDKLNFYTDSGATGVTNNYFSTRLLRDVSSWYHIVVQFDKASGTVKGYINGNLEGTLSWNTGTNGNLNRDNYRHHIGRRRDANNWFVGYIADFHWIDGQAKIPTDFAEEYNGVWAPKAYSGTYGNNGFRLDFADNTSIGTATDDASPNTNDWTAVNLNGYDAVKDTPSNNFATYNYNFHGAGNNTLEGALKFDGLGWSSTKWGQRSTIPIPKDKKIYIEVVETANNNSNFAVGIGTDTSSPTSTNVGGTGSVTLYDSSYYVNGSAVTHGGGQYAAGAIIGIAVDGATGKVWFSKNGTWLGDGSGNTGNPSTGQYEAGTVTNPNNEDLFLVVAGGTPTSDLWVNFGQDSINITSAVSPSNGIGVFESDVPTGHVALCAKNISESAIDVQTDDRPEDYFSIVDWSANGSGAVNRSITGLDFQPDFVWSKTRDAAYHHALFDSVRGPSSHLATDRNAAQNTVNGGRLSSFDSNGFTWTANGSTAQWYNETNREYIAWCWKAGGAPTATNSAGAGNVPTSGSVMIDGVASTATLAGNNPVKKLSANTKVGFSIVNYTGDTTNTTKAHGLGKTPSFIIVKKIDATGGWVTWHKDLSGGSTDKYMYIDSTSGTIAGTTSNYWSGGIDANVFGGWPSGGDNNNAGTDYIAYLWTEIEGFSKFGSYSGNASTNGPYVNCGFKPSFVLMANTALNVTWYLLDNKIGNNQGNQVPGQFLMPSNANAQDTPTGVDFLANGFKIRTTGSGQNGSGQSHIFMAFAENPFKYAAAK